jgi:O-antigen ligase
MTIDRKSLDAGCERIILGLALALVIFAPLAFGAVPLWAFAVVQGLVALGLAFWAARSWAGAKPRLLWPPFCWIVLLFAVLAVGRYLCVDIEYVARLEMIQVVVFAALFFLAINNLYRQEHVHAVSFALILVATVVASYAVVQWLTHSNLVYHTPSLYPDRASGTFHSPNNMAGLLEMILPLAVAFLLAGRMKVIVRILLGYAIFVMLLGLGVSFSRGGWAGALTGLSAVFFILATHRNYRWRALVLLLVLSLTVVLFGSRYLSKSEGFRSHIKDLQTTETSGVDIRLSLWKSAERMWQDHFWWGVGPGLFDYRFREYRPEEVQARPDRVHNEYLNLLADWGAVGGALVSAGLTLYLIALVKTWRHVRRSENDFKPGQSNRFAFYAGAIGGLLALSVQCVVDFTLHVPADAAVGVILLALLISNLRFSTEKYWVNIRLPLKITVSIILVGMIGYLGRQGWQRAQESRWLSVVRAYPDPFTTEHMKALEAAFAVDNKNFNTTYNLGEAYRLASFQGGNDYEAQAKTALGWYELGWKLDPYDSDNHLGAGMCLDWLDRHDAAELEFRKAEALDPNGYFTIAHVGWHFVQAQDDAAARQYFLRSLHLIVGGNDVAQNYLHLTEQRLVDKANNTNALPFGF